VIPRFALVRPASIGAALAAHSDAGGDAAWYAGGTELLQVMKMGLARFGTLIDLKGLPELRGIGVDPEGSLIVGATATHREIERSPIIRRELVALAVLESHVANVRVRNQGTLGGNLCFAEPHSDPATFLLACDARVVLEGPAGRRELPLDAFLVDPFVTARAADEILVSIVVPSAAPAEGRAYEKVTFRERPAVSVAVRLRVDGGAIAGADVVVGSMTDVPVRVPAAAAGLVGAPADGIADGLARGLALAADAVARLDAADDLDGSADFKRHLAGVLLGRAARAALGEATARA
jgi:carbon-monoxide dehydrogenase medium subunit